MLHYLIVYDRSIGRLVEVTEFDDSIEALKARFEWERLERGDPALEIVVLGAESRQDLELTHLRYFSPTLSEAAPRR
jgi:hypothetical protein